MAQREIPRSAIGVADDFHSVTKSLTYLSDAKEISKDRSSSGRSKRNKL